MAHDRPRTGCPPAGSPTKTFPGNVRYNRRGMCYPQLSSRTDREAVPVRSSFIQINKEGPLAKPNYSFQKRQKEIAKQKKKEEKLKKKQAKKEAKDAGLDPDLFDDDDDDDDDDEDEDAAETTAAGTSGD